MDEKNCSGEKKNPVGEFFVFIGGILLVLAIVFAAVKVYRTMDDLRDLQERENTRIAVDNAKSWPEKQVEQLERQAERKADELSKAYEDNGKLDKENRKLKKENAKLKKELRGWDEPPRAPCDAGMPPKFPEPDSPLVPGEGHLRAMPPGFVPPREPDPDPDPDQKPLKSIPQSA